MEDFYKYFTFGNLAQVAGIAKTWTLASIFFLKANIELLKLIIVLVSILLLAGIIYAARRGIKELQNTRVLTFKDVVGVSPAFHPKTMKAWKTILNRLATKEEGQIKLAVIEADRLFDHLLVKLGYRGKSFEERFSQLTPSQISDLREIGDAHTLVEKVLNEPDTQITYEGAERIINIYKKAFEEAGLMGVGS